MQDSPSVLFVLEIINRCGRTSVVNPQPHTQEHLLERPRASLRRRIARTFRAISPLLVVTLLSTAFAGNIDIGNPTTPGSTTQSGDQCTIVAGGTDIFGTSDQFHYSHQTISGSGALTVKVESVSDSDPWAKAGVMVRADTAVGSPHASVFATHKMGGDLSVEKRPGGFYDFGQSPRHRDAYLGQAGAARDDFSAFYSDDGKKWTQIGSTQTVVMKKSALAGLAVTAHCSTSACTAKFKGFLVKR